MASYALEKAEVDILKRSNCSTGAPDWKPGWADAAALDDGCLQLGATPLTLTNLGHEFTNLRRSAPER
jgi:hypothetical protein